MIISRTFARNFCFTLFLLFLMVFSSCTARIEAELREGGAVELGFQTSMGSRAVALISSLRSFAGDETDELLLNGPSIAQSLTEVPGIRSVSIRNISSSSLEGNISISNIADFLASGDTNSNFVTYNEGQQNSSIIITLDRETAPELIFYLSPDILEYFHAIFAPAIQGDIISRQEYLDLLASFYGRPLSDEIAAATIQVQIRFPRQITSVQGGSFTGRQAEFSIPLVDILVLEQPLRYEVRW